MPIHDLGYRAWQVRPTADPLRWCAITETGVRLAWRNRWLRRLLLASWLPAFYLALALFGYEQWLTRGARLQIVQHLVPVGVPISGDRHSVWAWLLMIFFRYPQAVVMLLVVGLIAPPLVAQDVKSRAFLLYFSRPLMRLEYMFGKLAVLWAYLLTITTLPALALYVFAVLLSPDLGVVRETWDLPLRLLLASVILILPTTTLALALSSLTSETRYASHAWFVIWLLGWAVHGFLFASQVPDVSQYWKLVSLYHTLGEAQTWAFGVGNESTILIPALALLAAITVGSLAVLVRRISSPMRI